MGFSGVKDFLHITGIQIHSQIFRIPRQPLLRGINGTEVEASPFPTPENMIKSGQFIVGILYSKFHS
jgi:hypothetical protein